MEGVPFGYRLADKRELEFIVNLLKKEIPDIKSLLLPLGDEGMRFKGHHHFLF